MRKDIASAVETLRPEGLSYTGPGRSEGRPPNEFQNNEKQCVSAVLIWAQATLVSVAMMSIPSAQNSPRFCCIVRLMTLSSIRIPRRERSAGAPLAKRSGGMRLRFGCRRRRLGRFVADQADFAQQ